MIERLLDAGAPIDAPNRDGQTPLLLLLGVRTEAGSRSPNRELAELIQRLLQHGADLDVQDRRGISVLHAAAMHGMRDIAERLLKAGADLAAATLPSHAAPMKSRCCSATLIWRRFSSGTETSPRKGQPKRALSLVEAVQRNRNRLAPAWPPWL